MVLKHVHIMTCLHTCVWSFRNNEVLVSCIRLSTCKFDTNVLSFTFLKLHRGIKQYIKSLTQPRLINWRSYHTVHVNGLHFTMQLNAFSILWNSNQVSSTWTLPSWPAASLLCSSPQASSRLRIMLQMDSTFLPNGLNIFGLTVCENLLYIPPSCPPVSWDSDQIVTCFESSCISTSSQLGLGKSIERESYSVLLLACWLLQ